MGIAYSIVFFIACGIFLAAHFIWSIYRGVDGDVATVRARFGLGDRWERPLRIMAYWQIVMTGVIAIAILCFAGAVACMAAN